MNDRFLCKAKRTDNGEWVEGYYCKRKTGNSERRNGMRKAMFILDVPETCERCTFSNKNVCFTKNGAFMQCWASRKAKIPLETVIKGKPDWCPLQELPEKDKEESSIDFEKVLKEKLSAESFKVISSSEKEFGAWLDRLKQGVVELGKIQKRERQ